MYRISKSFIMRLLYGALEGALKYQTKTRGSKAELGLCTWRAKVTGRIHCNQVSQPLQNRQKFCHVDNRKELFALATFNDCSFLLLFFFNFGKLCNFLVVKFFVTGSFKWEWWTFVLTASWAALGKCPLSVAPCERPKRNTSEIWWSVQMSGPLGQEKKRMVAYL